MSYAGRRNVMGFEILNRPWGTAPLDSDIYNWWVFDRMGQLFNSSASYADGFDSVLSHLCYLGLHPDQIKFKPGDIVQFLQPPKFPTHHNPRQSLGVVLAAPKTIEEEWMKFRHSDSLDDIVKTSAVASTVDGYYLIAFGPYHQTLQMCSLETPVKVIKPSFPVTDDARQVLLGWYDEYEQARKTVCRLTTLSDKMQAYAARFKEIDPVSALHWLAEIFTSDLNENLLTLLLLCEEEWMKNLSKTAHPLAPRYGGSHLVSYNLINQKRNIHYELLSSISETILEPNEIRACAAELYRRYTDDTSRIIICHGSQRAIDTAISMDWPLKKFLNA